MDVLEAIFTRRSVRRYERRYVSDELVRKVLEAAIYAPSSKNAQPWEFIVIRNKETKERLAELAPYGKFLREAPVVIAVVTDPAKSPRFHEVDGACAVQNLALAAHALGLATCWIGTMDREAAKPLLGVPPERNLLTVLPLGYPAERPPRPWRRPLSEIAYSEKYGLR